MKLPIGAKLAEYIARRQAAGMPALGEVLPPLAAFAHDGTDGPITLAVDLVAAYLGGSVGVVSL